MKISFLLIPVIFAFSSCKKDIGDLNPTTTVTPPVISKTQGYIQLECENCSIGYGMPDQYQAYNNANGLSVKYPFTYTAGYNLQALVSSIDHEQKLTVKIYDTNSKLIYTADKDQAKTGGWAISILLPSVESTIVK
jgi:hypothetical protein